MSSRSTLPTTSSGRQRERTFHAKTFRATVVPAGNATGADVPVEVVDALGHCKQPKVVITINGHPCAVAIASKGRVPGRHQRSESRRGRHFVDGDDIEVSIELDSEPREVAELPDLTNALDADTTIRAAFDRLPFWLRRKHVNNIEAAKSEQTRQRRIERLVQSLR
jgi:hypothetical protein